MSGALAALALPALACAALAGIHAFLGLHVLRRNAIFADLALAQGGPLYLVAAAAALLLAEGALQGAQPIRRVLTGELLAVGGRELAAAIALYAVVGLAYPRIARRLEATGWLAQFAFYAAFALVVTSSVAIAGMLPVIAFLIVPACIGMLHAARFSSQLAIAWTAGTLASVAGLAIAYAWGLSAGTTLVCTLGAALAAAGVAHGLRMPQARGAKLDVALRFARWLGAALLAASGFWIAAAPRADQPVLDALERAFPAIRAAYMDAKSRAVGDEAAAFALRYGEEARGLEPQEGGAPSAPPGEREARRLARLSYEIMLRGEAFVAREARDRARVARRGWIAAVFLLIAASLVVSLPSRKRRPSPP